MRVSASDGFDREDAMRPAQRMTAMATSSPNFVQTYPWKVSIVRSLLFENDSMRIGLFEANPTSDRSGDVESQTWNAVVLPFAGVFSKHDAPGRHVIGTPSHAVFIDAGTPYRISFPGAIGDRAIVLHFDDALDPMVSIGAAPSEVLRSNTLLPANTMIRRNLLRRCLGDPARDPLEIETIGLELLGECLHARCGAAEPLRPAVSLRRSRAVERVKEAVAVAPAEAWNIAALAKIAHLSPFHLCHVFREFDGTSIYDYVLRERLAQALNIVLDGGADITTIALDAGFSSHSHFTARFRRFFGCTPTALRRTASAARIDDFRKIMTAPAAGQA
jgi:AraC family transcriptional regulator